MNRTVETNLLAIITGLTDDKPCCHGSAARCACAGATINTEVPDVG